LRRLESEQRSPSRPLSDIIKETEEIHTVISSEIRRIQEANPGFAATGLTAADLSTAIPDETTACVLFAVTSLGTILFLLHREGLDARCEAVLNSRFTARNLIAAHRRWVLAYQKYRMEPRGPAADEAWGRAINRIMDGLSRELFVPVTGRLSQIRPARILLVPHGALHLFPLHLLRMPSGGRTRPLIDFCEVALAPRLKLPRRHSESTGPRQAKFVGIANPTLDLHWADHEVQAISQLFGANARILSGIQATKENVLSAVQHAKYIHFACHGSHDLTQPFASSLILSPFSHRNTAQPRHNPAATTYLKTGSRVTLLTGLSAPWTLNDMFAELKLDEPELVVLSACESGAGLSSTGGEDFIGLSTAFLHCGARNVVASSWIVDDEWASALMERFYTLVLTQGLTASAALRAAQLWLRDGMGQGNPAIWAAFHVTGK